MLIENGADINAVYTPLRLIYRNLYGPTRKIVELLIKYGVNINDVSSGDSPLNVAVIAEKGN